MADILFHPSSVGRLMTEPKSQKEGPLSVGARTYVRELVAQDIFGVDFEVSSKEMEKGTICEQASIDLFNRVRGRSLVKNTQRYVNEFLTGEPDLVGEDDVVDIKTAWSIASFPLCWEDVNTGQRALYEWQLRAYMLLADKARAAIAYTMVTTPDELLPRYEPQSLHFVEHVPEHLRLTMWSIERDAAKETALIEKIKAARTYYREVVAEFDRTHRQIGAVTIDAPAQPAAPTEIEKQQDDPGRQRAELERQQREIIEAAEAERAEQARRSQEAIDAAKTMAAAIHQTDPGMVMTGCTLTDALTRKDTPAQQEAGQAATQGTEANPSPCQAQTSLPEPNITLGAITRRLGFSLTEAFIRETLGIEPCGNDRRAVLFKASDFARICQALINHLGRRA